MTKPNAKGWAASGEATLLAFQPHGANNTALILIMTSSLSIQRIPSKLKSPNKSSQEGDHRMRFYTKNHKYYCGIDLHTKMMYKPRTLESYCSLTGLVI